MHDRSVPFLFEEAYVALYYLIHKSCDSVIVFCQETITQIMADASFYYINNELNNSI